VGGTSLVEKVAKRVFELNNASYSKAQQHIEPKDPNDYPNTGRYRPPQVLPPNPKPNQGIVINPLTIKWNDARYINNPNFPLKFLDNMINARRDYLGAHEDTRTAAKKAKHLRVDDTDTS